MKVGSSINATYHVVNIKRRLRGGIGPLRSEVTTMSLNDNNNFENNLSIFHQAALDLAARGIPVFPLVPGAKNPIVSRGFHAATTDVNQINALWADFPNANIGMPTAGLLVLDVDCKGSTNGYDTLTDLETKHEPLPLTRTQSTPSGGKHYIYSA
ncbi:bifunctional DNA primase/polymerase, partial [Candidatus Nomurabacteria bacterium]|nr:bifunctional DNA primase/polymerase [Candidatus Nomurabacteria bacterium]